MQHNDDGNRRSEVYLATRLWAEDRRIVVRFSVEEKILSSPKCLDWCWGPSSLLFSKYWGVFSQGQGSRGVTLATCPPTRSSEFENSMRYALTPRHAWFIAQEQIYFLLKTLIFNTANNHYGFFYTHGSVHRESNLITDQQVATYSVYYISVGNSTCFGC